MTTFLLNDSIALDAGSLAQALTMEEQLRVKHVIVTHSHLDHTCGLPFFSINVFGEITEPVLVYGTRPVLTSLRKHMFNDVLWPDFTRLPSRRSPTLRFREINDGQRFTLEKLTFTPIPVNHLTPTVGLLIEDARSAVLFSSDTGPTELVWEIANRTKNLRAVITEASFPNEEEDLARASGHLTPELLERELQKLGRRVRVLITHFKPAHRSTLARQLRSIRSPKVELLEQGKTYRF
jgi:ribonuclease BN (tRNA processing enzyme)